MGRFLWTALLHNLKFMAGRGFNTFANAQYNSKYIMVLAAPGVMCYTRYRAETKLGYAVMITDRDEHPTAYPSDWKNGKKIYLPDSATVGDVKAKIFADGKVQPSARLRVGCRGRVMADDDNLGNAVRCFCRRDPRLVMWLHDE